MQIDPNAIKWDAAPPDPGAIKWDAPPRRRATDALPPMQTKPDDPGILGALAIGAGKTVDSVLDGLAQLYLGARGEDSAAAALKQTVDEKRALYRPLQEARPFASAIGEALPAMIVPVGGAKTVAGNLGRLAAAGALPGALEYGSAGERAGRAAAGAAGAVAGGIVAPKIAAGVTAAVPAVGRTVRAVVEPLTASGRQNIAGRTLNRAAGADAAEAAARLARATPLVPGSMPTAAQVAENGGIAALERQVAAANPADFTSRAMEQTSARLQALRGLAQDDGAIAAARAARAAAADPLFQQAKGAVYAVDDRLANLLKRPSVQAALTRAQRLAADDGRTFQFATETAAPFAGVGGAQAKSTQQITGQGLYDLKMAMDELLSDPASGFAGKAGDAVRSLRGQLLNWMEDANPVFRQARTTYADMSRPINQMQVGQTLLQKVEPALSDFGALGRETGARYAQALRNTEQTARQATGFRGVDSLADVLDPQQIQLVTNIAQDLARKANAQDLGRGVGSDTFQKLAMSNIAERSGAPGVVDTALSLPGVNRLAQFLYSGPDEEIKTLIAQALLNPAQAAQAMQRPGATLVPQIDARQILLQNPSRAAQILGGTGGLATTNLFAQ